MFKNFQEIEEYVLTSDKRKKLVLCGAHDEVALEAVVNAKRKKIVDGILIGDEPIIQELLASCNAPASDYEIIHEPAENKAAALAFQMVNDGIADIPMKGKMQSTTYLTSIMNPLRGLMDMDTILSETTVVYYPDEERLILITDCALNVAPDLEDKKLLIKNAAKLANILGIDKPKVAVLSAVENPAPNIVSSMEANELAMMEWDNGITVEGPFALDNAVSLEAAKHKGISSKVAGRADILLIPELCAGNILHKSLHFFAHIPTASIMCGTTSPVVFTSRTDSFDTKYYSILCAVLESMRIEK